MILRFSLLIVLFLTCSTSYAGFVCAKDQTIYDGLIMQKAMKHKVHPALIHAIIKQESCYDKKAVSHAGAQGLMQLMPATADRFNVKNAFNPGQNIDGGVRYIKWLLKRFDGNVKFALAGYNAGEGRVDQYKGIPPFKETRNYVVKVVGYYNQFRGASIERVAIAKKKIPTGLNIKRVPSFKARKKHKQQISKIVQRKKMRAIKAKAYQARTPDKIVRVRSFSKTYKQKPKKGHFRVTSSKETG